MRICTALDLENSRDYFQRISSTSSNVIEASLYLLLNVRIGRRSKLFQLWSRNLDLPSTHLRCSPGSINTDRRIIVDGYKNVFQFANNFLSITNGSSMRAKITKASREKQTKALLGQVVLIPRNFVYSKHLFPF